jgi:hypothetical protein
MIHAIKVFQREARELGRDANSVKELKLWFQAMTDAKFDYIFEKHPEFKTQSSHEIIQILKNRYHLDGEEITDFLKRFMLRDEKEAVAPYDVDQTEGRPGHSYEEIRDVLTGLGI